MNIITDDTVKDNYNTNKEIKSYIDGYAEILGISVDEAFTHLIVKNYVEYKLSALNGKGF